jgi:glycosyltransferase involved in cell wall biosynthesis
MKVLHILSSNKLSGAENVAVEIIRMFNEKIEMVYASPEGEIRDSLINKKVNYIAIEKLSVKEIKRIIRLYKPDIIHAHDIRATIIACCATIKIPIVSHIHGNHDDMKKVTFKSLLYLFFSKRVKKIITVSNSVVEEYVFSKLINKKTVVLYNVINKDLIYKNLSNDKNEYNYDFIFLGRLEHPKDPLRVAQVAQRVIKNVPSARFGVIGDGSFKEKMKELFELEGVNKNVDFLGFMNNPYKVLSQAKAMMMCSKYEGTPMAALEAMVLGVPIVSTPVDGMKVLINNGVNGFISNKNDELVNLLTEIITGKHKYLSGEAQKSMTRFTNVNEYKEQLIKIYNGIR